MSDVIVDEASSIPCFSLVGHSPPKSHWNYTSHPNLYFPTCMSFFRTNEVVSPVYLWYYTNSKYAALNESGRDNSSDGICC
ncbi:hypothetical protein P8452_31177 [Trifolium repens]|nr:hypothetical protein P8452_31177 [Trifolium repens]